MSERSDTADIPRLLVELRERGFGDAAYEIERLRAALLSAVRFGEGCSDSECWDGAKRDDTCKCNRIFLGYVTDGR